MKIAIIFILGILMVSTVMAESYENKAVLGEPAELTSVEKFLFNFYVFTNKLILTNNPVAAYLQTAATNKMIEQVKENQVNNADSPSQALTEEEIYQLKKNNLSAFIGEAWALVVGTLLLVKDTILLIAMFVEMRLVLYIFVTLLPQLFNKLTDSIAKSLYGGSKA